MRKKEITFLSDNLNLYGEIYFPDKPAKSQPALIICHGIPAVPHNPDERGYALFAETFCSHGFSSLIFNFRGAGLSEGNLDMLGWTRDLEAAITYFSKVDEVQGKPLALLGSSGGAAVSVYVAAHDARISSVATLACPAHFNDLVQKEKAQPMLAHFRNIGVIRDQDFPLSVDSWLNGFQVVAPINFISKIAPRPVLLLHGDQDDTVPVDHARQLYQQAQEPRELVIIPGASHRLRLEEKAIAATLRWLLKITPLN